MKMLLDHLLGEFRAGKEAMENSVDGKSDGQ